MTSNINFILEYNGKRESIKSVNEYKLLDKKVRTIFDISKEQRLIFYFYIEMINSSEPRVLEIRDENTFNSFLSTYINECCSIVVQIEVEKNLNFINYINDGNDNINSNKKANEDNDTIKTINLMFSKLENYETKNEELINRINIMEQNLNKEIQKNNDLEKIIKRNEQEIIHLKKEMNDKNLIIEDLKEKYNIIKKIENLFDSNLLKNNPLNKYNNISSAIITLNKDKLNKKNNNSSINTLKSLQINILKKSQIKNEKTPKLSCKFLNLNNDIKKYKKETIKINQPIKFKIGLINTSDDNITWPNDTFIRCVNDDSNIYFKSSKTIEIKKTDYHYLLNYFVVDIYFKNYLNIEKGIYLIKYELISDSQGKIGNETGFSQIAII